MVRKTPAAASTTTSPANRNLRWRSVRSIGSSLFAVVAFHRTQPERHLRCLFTGLAGPQRRRLPATAATGVLPALGAGRGVPLGAATAGCVLGRWARPVRVTTRRRTPDGPAAEPAPPATGSPAGGPAVPVVAAAEPAAATVAGALASWRRSAVRAPSSAASPAARAPARADGRRRSVASAARRRGPAF